MQFIMDNKSNIDWSALCGNPNVSMQFIMGKKKNHHKMLADSENSSFLVVCLWRIVISYLIDCPEILYFLSKFVHLQDIDIPQIILQTLTLTPTNLQLEHVSKLWQAYILNATRQVRLLHLDVLEPSVLSWALHFLRSWQSQIFRTSSSRDSMVLNLSSMYDFELDDYFIYACLLKATDSNDPLVSLELVKAVDQLAGCRLPDVVHGVQTRSRRSRETTTNRREIPEFGIIKRACERGHGEIVIYLLDVAQVDYYYFREFSQIAYNCGHFQLAERLA
jgi:hypothetical protein